MHHTASHSICFPHLASTKSGLWCRVSQIAESHLIQADIAGSCSAQSSRRKPASPSSLAKCSASSLQSCVLRANLASCFCSVLGGPFEARTQSSEHKRSVSSSLPSASATQVHIIFSPGGPWREPQEKASCVIKRCWYWAGKIKRKFMYTVFSCPSLS